MLLSVPIDMLIHNSLCLLIRQEASIVSIHSLAPPTHMTLRI